MAWYSRGWFGRSWFGPWFGPATIGPSTTLRPPRASLTVTGYAPTTSITSGAVDATPATAPLTITTYAPTVTARGASLPLRFVRAIRERIVGTSVRATPPTARLGIFVTPPTVRARQSPPRAALPAPRPRVLATAPSALVVVGHQPAVRVSVVVRPQPAVLSLSGDTATWRTDTRPQPTPRDVGASSGVLVVVAYAPTVRTPRRFAPLPAVLRVAAPSPAVMHAPRWTEDDDDLDAILAVLAAR